GIGCRGRQPERRPFVSFSSSCPYCLARGEWNNRGGVLLRRDRPGRELGNQHLQGLPQRVFIIARDGGTHVIDLLEQQVDRAVPSSRLEDLRVRGGTVMLVGMEQCLGWPLAWRQARVENVVVPSGLVAGQPDHLLGEQLDRYRIAHVKGVDGRRRTGGGRLYDQLAGLGD